MTECLETSIQTEYFSIDVALRDNIQNIAKQIVSWTSDGKPVTFGDFLISNVPELANEYGLKKMQVTTQERIRKIDQLTDDEIHSVTIARLQQGHKDATLAVLGKGDFNTTELIKEVKSRTEIGSMFIIASRDSIALLENCFLSRKAKPSKKYGKS